MIFDRKENAGRYLGLSANMDKAMKWLESADLAKLSEGRTEIDGDNVFVNVMNSETKTEPAFEFHHIYFDVQILIDGAEDIWFGTSIEDVTKPYTPDIGFCSCDSLVETHLAPGSFVICWPEEPHAPLMARGGTSEQIRKAVIKVKA